MLTALAAFSKVLQEKDELRQEYANLQAEKEEDREFRNLSLRGWKSQRLPYPKQHKIYCLTAKP